MENIRVNKHLINFIPNTIQNDITGGICGVIFSSLTISDKIGARTNYHFTNNGGYIS